MLRALHPKVYEQQSRTGLIPEIDPALDDDMSHIAIAQELGVPAPEVWALPYGWTRAALVRIRSRQLIEESHAKRRSRKG